MKTTLSTVAVAMALALYGLPALAQPSGGPDAKGNAPLKTPHTVNDGTAKAGHTSFTQGQARTHIETSGFSNVSGLVKGDDGVWRGEAVRNGQTVDVAMDFKGNVTTTAKAAPTALASPAAAAAAVTPVPAAQPSTTTDARATHHRRRHTRHVKGRCADPGPNGAACSGVDTRGNGISDKEERAIQNGAHP